MRSLLNPIAPGNQGGSGHDRLPSGHLRHIPAYVTLLLSGMALILSVVSFFGLRKPVPILVTILDLAAGIFFLILGVWIYRYPKHIAPRVIVVGVLTIGSTLALTAISQTSLIPLTSMPILIALIMFERIEVLLLQPVYLIIVLIITPFGIKAFSVAMIFFQILVFLTIWLIQSRTQHQERIAAQERMHRAVAELKSEQEAQQRLLVEFFQHELRNAAEGMSGLVPLLRMLLDEIAPTRPQGHATTVSVDALLGGIERNADGLYHITQQLLLLSRSGDVAVVRAPCQALPLLRQAQLEAQSRATWHQLAISANIEIEDENLTIAGDEQWITLALRTAARNAFDALSGAGEGRLTLRATATDTTVALQIEDTGPGFTDAQLQQINDVVASGEILRWTTKMGGSGIGIACIVHVMRLHQGQAVFENAPEGGARISLIFAKTEALQ